MWKIFKDYFLSATAKDTFYLFLGTIISTVLNFVLVIILTRNLSVADFGLFITALTFSQLVSDLFEMGINPATLNYVSSQPQEKLKFIKGSLVIKLIISILVGLGTFLLSYPISLLIFNKSAIIPYIQISSIGIMLLIISAWGQTVLQGEKRFLAAAIVNTSPNLLRLFALLLILILGLFTAFNALWSFYLVLFLTSILVFIFIGKSFIISNINKTDLQKIISFGIPIGLGFSVAAVYTRLDQILVLNLAGEEEAGIYGLASRVAIFFIFASTALSSAAIPRFTSISDETFFSYFKKNLQASGLLVVFSILAIILAPVFLPLIFGTRFYNSVMAFQILTLGAIFFTLESPFINAIVYRYKKNKFSLTLSLISLTFIWILLNLLIPVFGSVGAAIAVAAVYLLQLLISAIYFYFKARG
jgi:O-antigen/teichoic acid export membrane protein